MEVIIHTSIVYSLPIQQTTFCLVLTVLDPFSSFEFWSLPRHSPVNGSDCSHEITQKTRIYKNAPPPPNHGQQQDTTQHVNILLRTHIPAYQHIVRKHISHTNKGQELPNLTNDDALDTKNKARDTLTSAPNEQMRQQLTHRLSSRPGVTCLRTCLTRNNIPVSPQYTAQGCSRVQRRLDNSHVTSPAQLPLPSTTSRMYTYIVEYDSVDFASHLPRLFMLNAGYAPPLKHTHPATACHNSQFFNIQLPPVAQKIHSLPSHSA